MSDRAALAAQVRARVEPLEAERDIVHRLYAYSHHLDLGEDEAWVRCFTEDGAIDVHYLPEKLATARLGLGTRHEKGVRHQGWEALRVFIAGHDHPPKRFKHLMIEPRITLDGPDRAHGASYLVRVDEVAPRKLKIQSFGRYLDRYRRVGPHDWRIEERVVEIEGANPRED